MIESSRLYKPYQKQPRVKRKDRGGEGQRVVEYYIHTGYAPTPTTTDYPVEARTRPVPALKVVSYEYLYHYSVLPAVPESRPS